MLNECCYMSIRLLLRLVVVLVPPSFRSVLQRCLPSPYAPMMGSYLWLTLVSMTLSARTVCPSSEAQ